MPASLEVALLAAFVTFLFGLLLLVAREALERHRERSKARLELRSLIDLYLGEVASSLDRCVQYVRQVYLAEVSRSRLSILIGASRFDRLAALHVDAEVLNSLHDIYRMFDLVQNQVVKNRPDEFQAIPAFVLGDYHVVQEAILRVLAYARRLHGLDSETSSGRRLLHHALAWIPRIKRELLLGVTDQKKGEQMGRSFEKVESRIRRFSSDLLNWVTANSLARSLTLSTGEVQQEWLSVAAKMPKQVMARALRCLASYLKMFQSGVTTSDQERDQFTSVIIHAGNALISEESSGNSGEDAQQVLSRWRTWWIHNDIEFVDV